MIVSIGRMEYVTVKVFVSYEFECSRPSTCIGQKR